MIPEDILRDMDTARNILSNKDSSLVVVKNGTVMTEKKGDGVSSIMETIDEFKGDMCGSVVGNRIIGKASSLLCAYSKVRGVYSSEGTKTAIAVLIISGIPAQVDKLVPCIKNKTGDDICPFEQMIRDIDNPEEAYNLLKQKIKG